VFLASHGTSFAASKSGKAREILTAEAVLQCRIATHCNTQEHAARLQGRSGSQKLADRNRSLEFGRFLALCFRNPLAVILAVS